VRFYLSVFELLYFQFTDGCYWLNLPDDYSRVTKSQKSHNFSAAPIWGMIFILQPHICQYIFFLHSFCPKYIFPVDMVQIINQGENSQKVDQKPFLGPRQY